MRRAEPGDSHLMINEQRGAWAVPGPGEGSLSQNVVNLKCNTVSPKLSLISACLKFSLKDNIPKNSFLGGTEFRRQSIFSICFKLTRDSRPYLQREIVSPIFSPWGSFGHKVSELLPNTVKVLHEIWVARGDLICLQRSIALLPHDLDPKGFYSGRDKFGLEGIT
jgi:hypothetical protein